MKFAPPPPKISLENDLYPGTIVACDPVMDPDHPTLPLRNDSLKFMVNLRVQLDELDEEGNPIVLFRSKLPVSYGQYQGKWADYAQVIEAALGIRGGDKAQHNVDTDELLNKRIRVQTANVAKDERVYTNIVGYFAPKKGSASPQVAAAPRATAAPATSAAESVGLTDDDLESLPF